jgi:hypothetical protein
MKTMAKTGFLSVQWRPLARSVELLRGRRAKALTGRAVR